MTADRDRLAAILAQHLETYRATPHSDLASRLESPRHPDQLAVVDGTTPDGTTYTIETNVVWDDHAKRHIRVMSDLSTGTRGCLLGFIPIFTPDVSDGFIIAPDGTFIDE